jgi:outer membrane receptor for ferrienterochelin and colicins
MGTFYKPHDFYHFPLKTSDSTFAGVNKVLSCCLFFLIGPFLYLTKAQTLRFVDATSVPVEGVIVSLHSLSTEEGDVLITDNRGSITLKHSLPVIVRTSHFAYNTINDTIYNMEQEKQFSLVPKNINLSDVTVTGNYNTTDRSVYQTEVITRQQIRAQAANTVQDLFTHQLNVRVANDPSTGTSVSLQGIGGENIKVLVDGVPVIGRLYGNINLSQLNLNNIERVEVIRGPASVLYGTNALGGVINIITDASNNPPFKAGINTYYESTGQYNADVFANVHFRKTDVSLNGGRYYFDGWSENEDTRVDEWKPKEQRFGSIRLSHKFNKTKLVYQSSLFNEEVTNRGTPRILPTKIYAFDEHYFTTRFNNDLQLYHLFSVSKKLEVTGAYSYYQYRRTTYRKDLIQLNEILSSDSLAQDTNNFGATMLRAVYTKDDLNSKINYQFGIDINDEYTTGRRIENNKKETGDYAAFASMEFRVIKKLLLKPSLRYAYNTNYKQPVIPSYQAMYELNKRTVVRASYSKGFRSPSLKEQYLYFHDSNHDVYGNPDLKAEDSHHLLASADWTLSKGKSIFKISPSVFYNHIKNRISLVASDLIYTYLNFYEYNTQGGQLTASYGYANLQLSSGYSYTGIYNSEDGGKDFLYYSELNAMAQYKIDKAKMLLAVFWKYNGHQPQYMLDDLGSVSVFNGESYSMVDASVTKTLFKEKISVGAGVKNILDITTIKNSGESGGAHQASDNELFTGMGRSYFVRIQYQFSK